MTTTITGLRQTATWRALEQHQRETATRHLRELFAHDPGRGGSEETLFIVASKTFTTLETMRNASSARDWALARLSDEAESADEPDLRLDTSTNALIRRYRRSRNGRER
jgi:phosphoglucose isomerase-like protein